MNFEIHLVECKAVRLVRTVIVPLMLIGCGGLWGSAAVTRVSVEIQGVLVAPGTFGSVASAPGLRWHAPRSFARVECVPTERLREIAPERGRDLAGFGASTSRLSPSEPNRSTFGGMPLSIVNKSIIERIRDGEVRSINPRFYRFVRELESVSKIAGIEASLDAARVG